MATIELPLFHDDENPTLDGETVVLVIDRETGDIFDECWGWESAQNYALYQSEEFAFIAVGERANDWQRICDYNSEIRGDCFGLDTSAVFAR
jgi:hypothetical protein